MSREYIVILTREASETIDSDDGWFAEEPTRYLSKDAARSEFDRLNRISDEELELTEDVDNEDIDAAIVVSK